MTTKHTVEIMQISHTLTFDIIAWEDSMHCWVSFSVAFLQGRDRWDSMNGK